MVHPYPQANITQVLDIVDYSNTVTGGWYTPLLVILMNILLYFIISRNYQYKPYECLSASFIFGFFISSLLWMGNFITIQYMIVELALAITFFILAIFNRD